MKKISMIGAILLLFLVGCSIDEDDFKLCSRKVDPLCEYQKKFGGYYLGDSLRFHHSSGYDFSMTVVKDEISYRRIPSGFSYPSETDIPCDANGTVDIVQMRDIRLESAFPMLAIDLEMDGENGKSQGVNTYMGQYNFFLDDTDFEENSNPRSSMLDSLEINGRVYRDVAVIEGIRSKKSAYTDNAGVFAVWESKVPSLTKIFYTHKAGIIKIDFGDGTYIELREEQK